MTVEWELRDFAREVFEEVRDRAEGRTERRAPDWKVVAFTDYVIEILDEAGITENAAACYYEFPTWRGGNVKVDGYAVSDDEARLDLFATIHMDDASAGRVPAEKVSQAVARAARLLEAVDRGKIHEKIEKASDACSMAGRVHDLLRGRRLDRIRIFVLTDGHAGQPSHPPSAPRGIPLEVEVYDIERLFRARQPKLARGEIDLDIESVLGEPLPCIRMPPGVADYSSYLAVLPGRLLFDLYDKYGSRVLEFNVRSFLQAKGKVNQGIQKTLRGEPARFFAYNNGICVTVNALDETRLPDGRPAIRAMRGIQIVNGGQTTGSIHREGKRSPDALGLVHIPAKITVLDPERVEEMVPKISKFANTQNPVQTADFSANDPFHQKIEELSTTVWCPGQQHRWFYERARGQYQVEKARHASTPARARRFKETTPPARKFTKTDLAKFLHSWEEKPHLVSQGAQKNFSSLMLRLREEADKDWTPDEAYYRQLIAKAIIFGAVGRVVGEQDFQGYRANIVTYLVAYVAFRSCGLFDLDAVWESQDVSRELRDVFWKWSRPISDVIQLTADGKNVTEWCKKEGCWLAVRRLHQPWPTPLPPELAKRHGRVRQIDAEQLDRIARCKRVDAAGWRRILSWGEDSDTLDAGQAGLVRVLADLAEKGWRAQPSPGDAKQACRVLDLATQADLKVEQKESG